MDKILTIYFFKKSPVEYFFYPLKPVETNTKKIFVWRSWVYQKTKSVENITWNICNSLKSEKITSLVETNA